MKDLRLRSYLCRWFDAANPHNTRSHVNLPSKKLECRCGARARSGGGVSHAGGNNHRRAGLHSGSRDADPSPFPRGGETAARGLEGMKAARALAPKRFRPYGPSWTVSVTRHNIYCV